MWDFLNSVERSDIIQGIDAGRKPAVQAEDLVVDQGGEGEVVEEICEVFPDIGIAVFSQAFVVESVDLGDLSRFVVTAKDGDSRRIADLQGDEECHGLDGVVATIYVISYLMVSNGAVRWSNNNDIPIKR